MSKLKNLFLNGILVLSSLLLLLVFLELFIFRFVLLAPDMPLIDFKNGVVKYKPGQTGTYRIKDEIAAAYSINSDGWNSTYSSYDTDRASGKFRITVIGDSYIEAFSVNFNESIAEKLEDKLGSDDFEIYRFGISGAPMSQYLHMLRREVTRYRPDLVIVLLVHNDFDESYILLKGSYGSNFMKLAFNGDKISETEPMRFVRPWYAPVRESATWRYLAYRQQVPYNRLKDILLGNKMEYQGNIPVESLGPNKSLNERATDYLFSEMKRSCDDIGAKLLILIDGDRRAIYKNSDSKELYESGALSLNSLAARAAHRKGIDLIDLHPLFEADYKEHGLKFDFKHDGHWNAYGHGIAADAVYQYMKKQYIDVLPGNIHGVTGGNSG